MPGPAEETACGDPRELVARLVGDLGRLADRSYDRVERELRNAHAIGRLTVTFGSNEARRRVVGMVTPAPTRGPRAPSDGAHAAAGNASGVRPTAAATAAADAVIPGYDDLSASQVIQLLVELDPVGLRVIESHEQAHRGRRTILNRITQLTAGAEPPA